MTHPGHRFRLEREAGRVTVSFDDGGMNLLSRSVLEELGELLRRLHTEAFRVLVFRSARPNLFAAGADMKEMSAFSGQDAEGLARLGQEVFAGIEEFAAITVTLIDGDCFGGALDLAMASDLRLATVRSRFSHPGSRLGIVTGYGGTSRWRKLLEIPAARSILLGNAVFDSAAAMAMGLVDQIAEDFEGELVRLAHIDPASVRLVNELTNRAPHLSQRELALLAERLGELYGSPIAGGIAVVH